MQAFTSPSAFCTTRYSANTFSGPQTISFQLWPKWTVLLFQLCVKQLLPPPALPICVPTSEINPVLVPLSIVLHRGGLGRICWFFFLLLLCLFLLLLAIPIGCFRYSKKVLLAPLGLVLRHLSLTKTGIVKHGVLPPYRCTKIEAAGTK